MQLTLVSLTNGRFAPAPNALTTTRMTGTELA
jgi:hypothetical protein